MILAEFGTGQVFWSLTWLFLWMAWFWMLIIVFGDIFRSHDLGGWGKALWCLLVIVLPLLGCLVYLIARGSSMVDRNIDAAKRNDAAMREYIQNVTTSPSPSEELARLAELRDQGVIDDADFQAAKTKLLT